MTLHVEIRQTPYEMLKTLDTGFMVDSLLESVSSQTGSRLIRNSGSYYEDGAMYAFGIVFNMLQRYPADEVSDAIKRYLKEKETTGSVVDSL